MASATPQDGHRLVAGRTRPSATASGSVFQASSPHTPLSRSISGSLYASPGSSLRVDDENLLIFEIGSRCLRAGFAGENSPRCIVSYNPEQLRRVGDYRQYSPNYDARRRKRKRDSDWGRDYELWRPDVRDQDLSFLGDRLERLLREMESTQLMLDIRPRKVALVVSAQLPRPLLEVTLSALFGAFQCPTITVLPSNCMSIVSAGLRSALVVDIGWHETSISAIFEYREVSQRSTVRASKQMIQAYTELIPSGDDDITVEEAEDVLVRLGWCRESKPKKYSDSERETTVQLGPTTHKISISKLADPPDTVLFGEDNKKEDIDDDSMPIHVLAYYVLLGLPIDLRKTCLPRIVITGGASRIPGLKRRFLQELEQLIQEQGWNHIRNYGSAGPPRRGDTVLESMISKARPKPLTPDPKVTENTSSPSDDATPQTPAHLISPEPDAILAKVRQHQRQKNEPDPSDDKSPRIINSLGAWAGASLTMGLRVRGVVEIERERFLSVGLLGGAVKKEVSVIAQRQSMGPGVRPGVEKSHWNLGVWA